MKIVMDVTPAMAMAWVASCKRTNGIRGWQVAQHVKDMKEGKWHLLSSIEVLRGSLVDGILSGGELYEGRHRMKAVMIYGKPVRMSIDVRSSPTPAAVAAVKEPEVKVSVEDKKRAETMNSMLKEARLANPEMIFDVVMVTPAMAKEWLKNVIDNQRILREDRVRKYAEDMRLGNWRLTHQGIAFIDGALADGQTRLHAVIRSGCTVPMLVVRNAPIESFDHIDGVHPRGIADVLKINKVTWCTSLHTATARLMHYAPDARETTVGRSPHVLKPILEKYEEVLRFVFSNVGKKPSGIAIAPVLAAIGLAWFYEKDKQKLARFQQVLISGIAQDPVADAVVIRLREWLYTMKGAAGHSPRREVLFKTQRVIQAYMRGDSMNKIYMPTDLIYESPLK